ncbi:Programmed cell death protein 5 [Aix galericulata]|nr:Programmed cell death protein 5 [Aix galericulata]
MQLSNLALVKPDKAKAVENYLIQMARYGQLPGKITEQVLIEILEKASQQTEKTTTVKLSTAILNCILTFLIGLHKKKEEKKEGENNANSFPQAPATLVHTQSTHHEAR